MDVGDPSNDGGVPQVAGRLMVPYLPWVSFASVLNFAIWRMNA